MRWKCFASSTSLTLLLFLLSCRQQLRLKTPSCPATASRDTGQDTSCSSLDKLLGKVPSCCRHLLLMCSLCCCPRNQSHKPRSRCWLRWGAHLSCPGPLETQRKQCPLPSMGYRSRGHLKQTQHHHELPRLPSSLFIVMQFINLNHKDSAVWSKVLCFPFSCAATDLISAKQLRFCSHCSTKTFPPTDCSTLSGINYGNTNTDKDTIHILSIQNTQITAVVRPHCFFIKLVCSLNITALVQNQDF